MGGPQPLWDWTPYDDWRAHATLLSCGDGDRILAVGQAGFVCLSETDRSIIADVMFPDGFVLSGLAVSPDGRHLACKLGNRILLYDVLEPDRPRTLGPRRDLWGHVSMAFHPDGRTFALICGTHEQVELWNLDDLEPFAHLEWGIGRLDMVVFSPDGALGAAVGVLGRILIWDVD